MFCVKCGTEMTDDCSFCPKCGTPTSYGRVQKKEINGETEKEPEAEKTAVEKESVKPEPGKQPGPEHENKKLNIILSVIAVILAVVLLVLIILFFVRKSKQADNAGKATAPAEQFSEETTADTQSASDTDEETEELTETGHPAEAQEYNGHFYMVYDNGVSWTAAKSECEAAGGHLVTVSDADEENFVEGLVKMYGKGEYYWIGLSDASSEGTFAWVTGESVSYTNWSENQPDNWNDVEHYVRFPKNDKSYTDWSNPAGKWNDIAENGDENNPLDSFGYICEWEE